MPILPSPTRLAAGTGLRTETEVIEEDSQVKRSSIVGLVAVFALVLAACGDSGEEPPVTDATDAPVTTTTVVATTTAPTTTTPPTTMAPTTTTAPEAEALLIWADERRVPALQTVAPAFTEATGVPVTVELVPFGEIRDQVIQAGPAGEGPDIFIGAHDWTGELAANGVIEPIDLAGKRDQFLEVAVNAFGFGGQNYAVPYVTEAIALYYNTDYVSEAPATFDDVSDACETAASANAQIEQCVGMPGGGGAPDAYHNYPFVSAFGATIFAYDPATGSYDPSEVLLDSDDAVRGVEILETYSTERGDLSTLVANTDYDTAKNLFLEGKSAFWITGPWELGTLRDQDAVNWDVAVIPSIGAGPTSPFVGAQGFFLSAFSEQKLLAQTFLLEFLATDETMQALYDEDPRGTAWKAVQEGLTDDPAVQTFAASAANGVPMPNIPEMASVWGPLGDNLLLVRSGELGAAEAMKAAAEAVRSAVLGG